MEKQEVNRREVWDGRNHQAKSSEKYIEDLKIGARGFEPPTSWSRTRFRRLLKFVEDGGILML